MALDFKGISDTLSTVLADIASKKKALDDANAIASKAAADYHESMKKAQTLRQNLTDSLDSVLPPVNNLKVG